MKNTLLVILAILLGIIGLALIFSDPTEGETIRFVFSALFFFVCGLAIGFINPAAWMISGLTAWGGILVGGLITLNSLRRYGNEAISVEEPPYIWAGLAFLILPITLSLLGGYLGKQFRQMRTKPRIP